MLDPGNQGTLVAERYLLERRVSVQAWGSLWLGRDQSTRRLCAVRLGDVAAHEQAELAVRYHGELEAATQIRCENVIDVFDQGDWNGIPYLVMERLEGEVLSERLLRQRPLDPWTTYRIVAHVACALSRAHGVGVVHRDLDPDHVILVPAGKHEIAKVFDFAITRQEKEWTLDRSTKLGSQLGLPYYASPERAGGLPLDWRCDLWSLAVIAYECLTGRHPFESDALGDLLARILHEPIPEISCPTLDPCPGLTRWWERASARDRTERFQAAKELADELGSALRLPVIRVTALRPMFQEDYSPSPSVAPPHSPVRQTTRIGLGDSVVPQEHAFAEMAAAAPEQELGAEGDYEVVVNPVVDWRWVGVAIGAFVLLAFVYLGLGWVRQNRVVASGPSSRVVSASATAPRVAPPDPEPTLTGAPETAAVASARPGEARPETAAEHLAARDKARTSEPDRAVPVAAPPRPAPVPRAARTPPPAPAASPPATTTREEAPPPSTATFPPTPAPAPRLTHDYGI